MASYTISPIWGAGAQLFDNSGNVLNGGKIYTYAAGTTTPATTYTTPNGSTANSNPIVANSAGRLTNEIWLPVSGSYKFVLKDANDVLIATYDNIPTIAQPAVVNDASSVAYESGYEVTAGGFTIGANYLITSVGTTDFVAIGASANVVGVHFTATGVGSGTGTAEFSRFAQTKLQELVSVTDYGADPTGVADATTAFNQALAAAKNVYVPPGTYKVTNSVTVYGNLYGVQESSIINLEITSTSGKGFWMQANSSISNLTINRAVNAVPSSGFFGCAIAIGAYSDTTGALVDNVAVRNVTIVGSGTAGLSSTGKWNLICAIGNVSNFVFENIAISGKTYIPLLCHWARKVDGASYISYHPRNGIIRNITFQYDATTDANWGGVYLSACHDIVIENATAINCGRGFSIATGDVGGFYADAPSKGLVGSNLSYKNIVIKNHTNEAFWIGSTTYPLTDPLGGTIRWFFTDHPASVSIDGLIVEQGADSTNQEVLVLQWAHNVDIQNLQIQNAAGTTTSSTAIGIYVIASVNVNIEGTVTRQRACRIYSGANISLNGVQFVNPTGVLTATTGDVGVVAYGTTPTTTIGAAVSIGDVTVELDLVPCDIYPGLEFSDASGNRYTFAGSAKKDDVNQTLPIQPAPAAMALGATITLENGVKGLTANECAFTGFYRNVLTSGVGGVVPKNIGIVNSNFYSAASTHVYVDDTRDMKISGNYFSKGGYLTSTAADSADIRVNALATGTVIANNIFNPSLDTKSVNNIVVIGTASGVVINGNEFYKHNSDTGTYPLASAIYLNRSGQTDAEQILLETDYIVSNNFFGPAVVNQVLPSTARRSTTIGSNRIGNATVAPTSGIWGKGDVIFNLNAASAGYAGWICVSSTVLTDGAIVSGSTSLTVATGTGIANGDRINVSGAGSAGGILSTTVSSGGGTTTLTLAAAASTTSMSATVQTPGTWKTFGLIS